MRSMFRISTRLALTSALSIALCASLGMAQAQTMKKDKMHNDTMMSDRMSSMSDDDYDEMGIPVAPSYPWAAPGSLDLNHWTDYSGKHMKSGSATDAMMDARSGKMSGSAGRMDHMEDPDELIPVAPGYPWAAPGTLDLNYWTDYTERHMASGSATSARMDKMGSRDKMNTASMMHEEEEYDLLPVDRIGSGSLEGRKLTGQLLI